jgi:hypothetical protein
MTDVTGFLLYHHLIAQVKNIIRGNRRLAVWEVAEEVGITTSSCHTILTEGLGMHLVQGNLCQDS